MVKVGNIYSSNNYGDFRVIEYNGCKDVVIEFLLTGYKCVTQSGGVVSGKVKDKLFPSVFGVGFVGGGGYLVWEGRRNTKAYSAWCHMLERCYCPKYQKRKPSYSGVTACKEWHNFQTFAKWFYDNYIEGFHLDKDMRQRGVKNKVYSPETCTFVSQRDNNIEAKARNYRLRGPNGLIYEVYNMAKFCRENKLSKENMSQVYSGKASHHKGWVKA